MTSIIWICWVLGIPTLCDDAMTRVFSFIWFVLLFESWAQVLNIRWSNTIPRFLNIQPAHFFLMNDLSCQCRFLHDVLIMWNHWKDAIYKFTWVIKLEYIKLVVGFGVWTWSIEKLVKIPNKFVMRITTCHSLPPSSFSSKSNIFKSCLVHFIPTNSNWF